jgi:MOSC domain-containing protein YiiM
MNDLKVFSGKATLFLGTVETISYFESAINKQEMASPSYLSTLGLEGDECADQRNHGGVDRALHHFPEEHYAAWKKIYGPCARDWIAPGMGENISTLGITEETVHIGDRFQLGEAVIEVSQPRSPCYKLNHRFGVEDISLAMQNNGKCGWLYRVIQPGNVAPDSELRFIERDDNSLSIRKANEIFFGDPLNKSRLECLAENKKLAASWRKKVVQRLENSEVENWNFRLFGKDQS